MGDCMSSQILNGVIDNQSFYEIIYHISGSMKEVLQFEEQIKVGPKIGVGFQGVQVGGINYDKKKQEKSQKYYSEGRIPSHSFCSVGLNNIKIGCFLSIYAVKIDHSGKEVCKKLIFKNICIRTNQDICLRIQKDLTVKQLSSKDIEQLKIQIQKTGSTTISTFKPTDPKSPHKSKPTISNSQSQNPNPQTSQPSLLSNKIYMQKTFGPSYQEIYFKSPQTNLFDLDHSDVPIDMTEFLKYDWTSLQTIELDGCGIDDKAWYKFCQHAWDFFPNLKYIYLAGNKITCMMEGDLEQFEKLVMIELDYSPSLETNPLTEDSKRYLLKFALQHPLVSIYCSSIDESKYLPPQMLNQGWGQGNTYQKLTQNVTYPHVQPPPQNFGWFLILPPQMNQSRSPQSNIFKSQQKKIKTLS